MTQIEQETGTVLEEMQKKAVKEAAENGLFILTGGPGTGKTTTINAIIRFFEGEGANTSTCSAHRKSGQTYDRDHRI